MAYKKKSWQEKMAVLPYWRTLKAQGFLNEKYPGGAERHKELLEQEGYRVMKRGKRYYVPDFEKYLIH